MNELKLLIHENLANSKDVPDVAWGLSAFLSGLEKRGVTIHTLPAEFRDVGALNTACGGLRSNGVRTSLRNLVMLEGIQLTRDFLRFAALGAERVGWDLQPNHFFAELDWLDFVGDDAARLLDDYSNKLEALNEITELYFKNLRLDDQSGDTFLERLPEPQRAKLESFFLIRNNKNDGHYTRIFVYVMTHPELEVVPAERWEMRVEEIARLIRGNAEVGLISKQGGAVH